MYILLCIYFYKYVYVDVFVCVGMFAWYISVNEVRSVINLTGNLHVIHFGQTQFG